MELEINIMKNLNHPNIVSLKDVYETENSVEIVMEYLPGGTIKQKLRNYEHLSESLVRKYLRDVLDAVEYLHSFE